jgi:hypothetical protein
MKSRRPMIIKWNPLKLNCIALGNLDASICHYIGNDWRCINGYKNCSIVDLEFDPKNENYLLASYSNGKIRLFDIESGN